MQCLPNDNPVVSNPNHLCRNAFQRRWNIVQQGNSCDSGLPSDTDKPITPLARKSHREILLRVTQNVDAEVSPYSAERQDGGAMIDAH
jgi:hypothetical protein